MCASVCGFCRVRLVERGAPQSLPLMESGKVRCYICTPVVLTQLMNYEVQVVSFFFPSKDTARCSGDNRKSRDQRSPGRFSSWRSKREP